MPSPLFQVLQVRSVLRKGNSLPVIADTTGGTFVVKMRGAAQGILPLVSELIVGSLALDLGLLVPEIALVEMPPAVLSDDGNDELRDLLDASVGVCLGFRHLAGARDLALDRVERLPREFRRSCLFLDLLVENVDRTRANPNILLWNDQPWLIDHGSSLSFHYDLAHLTEDSPARALDIGPTHLFASELSEVTRDAAQWKKLLPRERFEAAVARVPDDFLHATFPTQDPSRLRALYAAYLWKRLKTL